jgi:nucleotidyltransferase-like protein
MPGEPDRQYVVARSVLLDALEALGAQREAVILVGAQAIYLHTGAVELAIAEFTTDADLALDPRLLQPAPEIESAMTAAGFHRGNRVGVWAVSRDIDGTATNVEVDLMVPEAIGGGGSRAARLAGHAKHVARKARGLEAALVDKRATVIVALEATDARSFSISAAGPAALIVSKIHKIRERLAERTSRRVDDKDALDVLRLLQATRTETLAATFVQLLNTEMARTVTDEALTALNELFSNPRAVGPQMAVRSAGPLADPDEIAGSCAVLASELVATVNRTRRRS